MGWEGGGGLSYGMLGFRVLEPRVLGFGVSARRIVGLGGGYKV